MKHLSVGIKMGVGVGLILIMTLVVGIIGYPALGNVTSKSELYQQVGKPGACFHRQGSSRQQP